jgi:F-type H+-transporting ATPase subunit delta
MAELATIARPYAEALFRAVQSDLSGTADWLNATAAVASDVQLQAFAGNPSTKEAEVFDLLSSVAGVALPEKGANFLRMVIDNGRVNALPEIAAQFRLLKNNASGTSDATLFSAFPLNSDALAEVKVLLEKRFGRSLNIAVSLDPELIGGIRAVVGDEVLDTSVKARLEQMKVALIA